MAKATIWFMNARAKRFLESTAIKGRLILEHSEWLNHLSPLGGFYEKSQKSEEQNIFRSVDNQLDRDLTFSLCLCHRTAYRKEDTPSHPRF